jgi:L-aminopeptidase/D-esterase-like protein
LPLSRRAFLNLTGAAPLALGATAGVVRFLEEQRVGYVVNASGDIVVRDDRRGRAHRWAPFCADSGCFGPRSRIARCGERRRALRATTLSVIATNVGFTKTELTKLAIMANTGAARAIHPYHTQSDGDQMLAVSTGSLPANASLTAFGAIAAEVVSDAILGAVMTA